MDTTQTSINSQIMQINAHGGSQDESGFPYVILTLQGGLYAINCRNIISIEEVRETTSISNLPKDIRGVSYYKNEAMNLYDLRSIFSMPSHDEYIRTVIDLDSKIDSHKSELLRVENAITKNKPFTAGEDCHACDLGRWYDSYKSNSITIKSICERVAAPHRKFHETIRELRVMQANGRIDEAADLCTVLMHKHSEELFTELRNLKQALADNKKELVLIVRTDASKKAGIIIDNAESVEYITEIQPLPPSMIYTEYVKKIGFRKKDHKILLILETSLFS